MIFAPEHKNMILASYAELSAAGVSYNTARGWAARGRYERIRTGGRSRLAIPKGAGIAESVENARRSRFNRLLEGLEAAFRESGKHFEKYRGQGYDLGRANRFARLEAVYTCLILNEETDDLEKYEAFSRYFPGEISFGTFKQYIYRIKTQGFESVLRDGRGKHGASYPAELEKLVFDIYKNPKKYNKTDIFRKVREYCEGAGMKSPSLRWVQDKCTEYRNYVAESRYGKSKSLDLLPYVSLKQAQNPDTQWQVDGFTLPFYYEGHKRLVLVAVMDSFSRAFVGYAIAESENTDSILEALADAVKNTGKVPAEIVFDNHSFQRTQEAGTLTEQLERMGCVCRKSENPRFKSLLERAFGTLNEQYLKQYPGYLGQGIRSRLDHGIPAPEYTDRYKGARRWLTRDQIRAIAIQAVHDYNHGPRLSREKRLTPRMEAYRGGASLYGLAVDDVTRNTLFLRKVSYLVSKGRITITRGGKKREYGFNSAEYMKYNGQRVLACYADPSEIYVFDRDNNFICTLKPKAEAYAAAADQRGRENRGYMVNAGITKGIRAKAAAKARELWENTDPEAAERMNPLTASKEAIEEIRQRGWTAAEAARIERMDRLRPAGKREKETAYGTGRSL